MVVGYQGGRHRGRSRVAGVHRRERAHGRPLHCASPGHHERERGARSDLDRAWRRRERPWWDRGRREANTAAPRGLPQVLHLSSVPRAAARLRRGSERARRDGATPSLFRVERGGRAGPPRGGGGSQCTALQSARPRISNPPRGGQRRLRDRRCVAVRGRGSSAPDIRRSARGIGAWATEDPRRLHGARHRTRVRARSHRSAHRAGAGLLHRNDRERYGEARAGSGNPHARETDRETSPHSTQRLSSLTRASRLLLFFFLGSAGRTLVGSSGAQGTRVSTGRTASGSSAFSPASSR